MAVTTQDSCELPGYVRGAPVDATPAHVTSDRLDTRDPLEPLQVHRVLTQAPCSSTGCRRSSSSCSSTRFGAAAIAKPAPPTAERPEAGAPWGSRATASPTSSTARPDPAVLRLVSTCSSSCSRSELSGWLWLESAASRHRRALFRGLGAGGCRTSCLNGLGRYGLSQGRHLAPGAGCWSPSWCHGSASCSRCRSAFCWRSRALLSHAGGQNCSRSSSSNSCAARPLITVLFMASVMLPLFVPDAYLPDKRLAALARHCDVRLPPTPRRSCASGSSRRSEGKYEGAMAVGSATGR